MKVKELIAALQKMPEDAEVFHSNHYCSDDATVDEVKLMTEPQNLIDSLNSAAADFVRHNRDVKSIVWLSGDHPSYPPLHKTLSGKFKIKK